LRAHGDFPPGAGTWRREHLNNLLPESFSLASSAPASSSCTGTLAAPPSFSTEQGKKGKSGKGKAAAVAVAPLPVSVPSRSGSKSSILGHFYSSSQDSFIIDPKGNYGKTSSSILQSLATGPLGGILSSSSSHGADAGEREGGGKRKFTRIQLTF